MDGICTLEQSQDGNESLYSALSRKSESKSRNVTVWLRWPEPSQELQNKKDQLILGSMTVHFKDYARDPEGFIGLLQLEDDDDNREMP